jgi:hypothetical protein
VRPPRRKVFQPRLCRCLLYNRGNARDTKDDLEGALQDYNEAGQLLPRYLQDTTDPRSIELNDASVKFYRI